MTSLAASLRVFARIEDPSDELFEYLVLKESVVDLSQCWVDLATPRDFEWSDEIREKAVEFGIVDDDGTVLATFDTMADAEVARGKAKIKINLAFGDEEDDRPKGAAKADEPVQTTMDSQTGEVSLIEAAAGL